MSFKGFQRVSGRFREYQGDSGTFEGVSGSFKGFQAVSGLFRDF